MTPKIWSKFPFLRFVLAFIVGILISINANLSKDYCLVVIVTLTLLFFLLLSLKKLYKFQLNNSLGITGVLLLVSFGFICTEVKKENLSETHIFHSAINNKVGGFKAVVVDGLKEKENSFSTIVEILSVKEDSIWKRRNGKILVYFEKDSLFKPFYGDTIISSSFFKEVSPPLNPFQFDYKKYLSIHNIYHQAYIRIDDVRLIRCSKFPWMGAVNRLQYLALSVRLSLDSILSKNISNTRELGIAKAFILGVKDELENEIVKAYSGVGAMHVLAVSGLHVGLIYQVVLWLFGWLSKNKKYQWGRWVEASILLSFIWAYAFVTGLSPSVVRATTMFSFIIVGDVLNRDTNIYNTLAVSAFLLLLINPFYIVEVGFQLSYLAVLGIVYLHPKLYSLVELKSTLMDKIWSITCVSIAAQFATFPLGLYYFHQFPTYFMLSNLLVIPGAIAILYLGIMTLSISWFEQAINVLSYLLELVIWFVNESIFWLNSIPGSLISGIDIELHQTLLIMAFLMLLLAFIQFRKLTYLRVATLILFLFSLSLWLEFVAQNQKSEMTIYAVKGGFGASFRKGKQQLFIADSNLLNNPNAIEYNVTSHWNHENIDFTTYEKLENQSEVYGNKLFVYHGKSFLFYEKPVKEKFNEQFKIDYLIVRNNAWLDKNLLLSNYSFKQLILDGTNNWKTRSFVKKNFNNCIDLLQDGAFIQKNSTGRCY